jgi:PAS domain-containing protein
MTEPEIDYRALFRALPGMVALLTPHLVYADANDEFLRLAGRTREQLAGHYLLDDFPDQLDDSAVAVRRNIQASLRQPGGTVTFLDQATDPPLGARPEHAPRVQATEPFTDGAVLVLYTDGLIERRREDIDTGLARLAGSLARHQDTDPDTLADALLADLLPPGGLTDDTALVILCL